MANLRLPHHKINRKTNVNRDGTVVMKLYLKEQTRLAPLGHSKSSSCPFWDVLTAANCVYTDPQLGPPADHGDELPPV